MKAIAPMYRAGFPDSLRGEPSNRLMLGEVETSESGLSRPMRWGTNLVAKGAKRTFQQSMCKWMLSGAKQTQARLLAMSVEIFQSDDAQRPRAGRVYGLASFTAQLGQDHATALGGLVGLTYALGQTPAPLLSKN